MKPPTPRSAEEVDVALAGSAWERHGDALELRRTFSSFAGALGFVVSVGVIAESHNHHPDIDLRWTTVILRVTTHQIDGLSERDLELARAVDALS